MKKILFLNGSSKDEFYNKERNKYNGVTATNIFINNNNNVRILRKLLKKLNLPFLPFLFGDWKNRIDSYDMFIISSSMYSLEVAKFIRKRSKKRIIHWYWNPVIKDINPKKIIGYDTELFSFDKEDCKNYDMNYISTYYFSNINLPKKDIKYDIYFLGEDKGRLNRLIELKNIFQQQGLNVKFHITRSKESDDSKYKFSSRISYSDVLTNIAESATILDYVQEGQNGMTQRPMEALFFRKKLITNDINIVNYDFYNSNNIFVLGKDDIRSLVKFIKSDYIEIDSNIIENYDFGKWLNRI